MKHFCEIILKSGHWPRRRCCLKDIFLFFFSSGGHLVQQSRTILEILVNGRMRIGQPAQEEILYLKIFSLFSSDGHIVQQSETILAILAKKHKRNNSVKLY